MTTTNGYSRLTSIQTNYAGGIKTAEQWRAFIAGGRNKVSRKVANNTVARELINTEVAIRLHDTDIVTVHNDGNFTLNSGGWLTVTTKERINRFTPAGLSQRNGVWYMSDGSLFYDGIVVDSAGKPVAPRDPAKYETKLRAIKKQARAYARGFSKAVQAGKVPFPSGGDCWGCAFRNDSGQTVMGTDHIRQHMTEKYYVPSLLVNAGRAGGYRDEQIGLMGIGGQSVIIDPEQVVYKYVVKQLQAELEG